jgi:hypothetical protein
MTRSPLPWKPTTASGLARATSTGAISYFGIAAVAHVAVDLEPV